MFTNLSQLGGDKKDRKRSVKTCG